MVTYTRTIVLTHVCSFHYSIYTRTLVLTHATSYRYARTYVRLFLRIYVHIYRYICTYSVLTPCSSIYVRSHTPIVVGYLSIAKTFGYDMLHPTFPEHMLCILHTIVIVLARCLKEILKDVFVCRIWGIRGAWRSPGFYFFAPDSAGVLYKCMVLLM